MKRKRVLKERDEIEVDEQGNYTVDGEPVTLCAHEERYQLAKKRIKVLVERVSPDCTNLTFNSLLAKFMQDDESLTPMEDSRFRRFMRSWRDTEIRVEQNFLDEAQERASRNDPASLWLLGYWHLTGCAYLQGVAYDAAKAEEQYLRACESGYLRAMFGLAMMYLKGWHRGTKTAEGLDLLIRAADRHHPTACNNLGRAFRKGLHGLSENLPLAVHYYRRAAELGHLEAQFALSVRYRIGEGVPQSAPLEGHWLRACVAGGVPSLSVTDRITEMQAEHPSMLVPFGMWMPSKELQKWVPNDIHNQMVTALMIHRRGASGGGLLGGIPRGVFEIILRYICCLPHVLLKCDEDVNHHMMAVEEDEDDGEHSVDQSTLAGN